MTGVSPLRPILLIDELSSPLGRIVIAGHDGRLCALEFGRARMARQLTLRYSGSARRRARDPYGISSRIRAYLRGDLTAIDHIKVETGGTAFQQRVWRALRAIRAGRTMSYGEMARALGHQTAVRAVGAANGRNPISIIVPCHRLIGGDGALTGYGGGLWRKRWLLNHEGASDGPPRVITPRVGRSTGRSRSPR